MHLAALLEEACRRHRDELALACDDQRLSYAQLDDMGRRLAAAFADAGLAGERVATLLPNGPELIASYLGCWTAGAVAAPFEYVDAPPEIAYGLADCGARWLLVHAEKLTDLACVDLARTSVEAVFVVGSAPAGYRDFSTLLATPPRALPAVPPESLAFILYTSGSTSLPKGVTHSHASAVGIIESVIAALRLGAVESRMVIHDSISHMGGWIEAFPLLHRGATLVLDREFEGGRFYENLRRWRPTIIGGHIDHLWQIVRQPNAARNDFDSVATVFTGGDELPLPLQRAFLQLTGKPIQVGWGMTEAIWLTIAREPELERRGYMGQAVNEVVIRVAGDDGGDLRDGEVGELCVRGPMVSPGYWNRPEADREVFRDGFLRTGDMGFRDPHGDLWFTGRRKQIIERNSENITPGEIEQALYRHPAVAEAGAFGVADADEGQVPVAYVAFKKGRKADEVELKQFLATQVAAFKVPVRILAIDQMPLTHSGKIDHAALAERYRRER